MLLNLVNQHHTVTDNCTGERQNTQLRHKAQSGIEQQQAEDNADYTIGAVSIITSSLRISCICSIIRTTISSSISGIGFIR